VSNFETDAEHLTRLAVPVHEVTVHEVTIPEARVLDLAGSGWTVREALGMTWQWYVNAPAPTAGNNVADAVEAAMRTPGWLPASVPGAVIADLVKAGELDDPFRARNSRHAEWVPERSWVYRRSVELPPVSTNHRSAGQRIVLEIDGIDPGGAIFWNGVLVGEVHGLYRRTRIDLTGAVPESEAGEGVRGQLAIVVEPSPDSEPQVGRTDRVRVHAPRMGYGWDFSPRMRHQGIWKGIRIITGQVLIADVTARAELADDGSAGTVTVTAKVGPPPGSASLPVSLEVSLWDGDREVATRSVTTSRATGWPGDIRVTLAVPDPKRWWPNGFGEQSLYRLTVTARVGEAFMTCMRPVGFRTVAMVQNPGSPSGALAYTAIVNGVEIPLLGWNWVPASSLYGTISRERIDHLVGLAARSGARLLRVWGGGLIESEDFYEACDRAGLLVWQEFSQSSSGMQSAPATDDAFVAHMREEAEAVIPQLVHHPSLLMWGGGNELDEGGVPLTEARSPVLATLRDTVSRLDPGRHWVATSPTGPEFHNRLDRIRDNRDGQHDVHGPWEHQGLVDHYTLYNAGSSLAHTEFGVEGMTNLRSLDALVPADDRWPTDRSNPVYRHLGEWWNNAELVQASFGARIETVEAMVRASQLLQATGLQYAIEADRRRAPRSSMVIPWQLHESYPNAWCTSSVDYRGDAKPAYHAVSRAFLADRVTIRTERAVWHGEETARAEAWVWSERGVGATEVVLRVRDAFGTVVAESTRAVAEVSRPTQALSLEVPVASLRAGASPVFVWEAEWLDGANVIDREVSIASAAADWRDLFDLPAATVEIVTTADPGDPLTWLVSIRHRSGPLVPGLAVTDARPVTAAGYSVIEGDPRPLLPGEKREYRVRWDVAAMRTDWALLDPPLILDSWNAGTHAIPGPRATETDRI
jgi:beta-mannosidase